MARRTNSAENKVQNVDTCRDATSLILDYLSGGLEPGTVSDFEKHLGDCPDCVAFLNTYKKTLELTKNFLMKK